MGLLDKLFLQTRTPLVELRRFRGKINIQRPQKLHYQRKLVMEVCRPILPSKLNLPQKELCGLMNRKVNEEIDNPFEHILAKECANWFNNSKMVAFLHLNPIPMYDKSKTFINLKKENMHLRKYGKKIVSLALTGTPYESVIGLFRSHTDIIFSENIEVSKLLKILRKTPQLILLAGIVDGKLLSKNEMVEYSKMPSLEVVQSQLCQVLMQSGMNLVQQITQHQSILVGHLDTYVKMQETAKDDNTKQEDPVPDAAT